MTDDSDDDLVGLGTGFPDANVLATLGGDKAEDLLRALAPSEKAVEVERAARVTKVLRRAEKKAAKKADPDRVRDPNDEPTDAMLLEQCERSMTTVLGRLRTSVAASHDADNLAAVLRRVRKRLGL